MKYITILFKKHKKHLPKSLENTFFGEILKYGALIFISAWVFQGILYMNWRESVIKILIDLLIFYILFSLGLSLALSIFIAHSLNFAFNGQLFTMYTHMGVTKVTPESFLEQTILCSKRLQKQNFIDSAIAYGSLSRGKFKSTSDIDIRFVPKSGEFNFWLSCLFSVKERCIAFINGYPLDLYVFKTNILLKKMRSDELPIMIYEKEKCMKHIYEDRLLMYDFVKMFEKKVIKNENI